MEKNNIKRMIITSIICLLPVCLSFVVYNDLPEKLVMQWNMERNPNWYAPKIVGAFGLPIFLIVLKIIINLRTYNSPKKENISKVMQIFRIWFTPVLSIVIVPLFLLMNLGSEFPIKMTIFILIGIVLVFSGNYLPKNRQNFIEGIRNAWTLNNPENWNKTQRLASILWIIGGILFIILAFLPVKTITVVIAIITIMTMTLIAPIVYSFILYTKEKTN